MNVDVYYVYGCICNLAETEMSIIKLNDKFYMNIFYMKIYKIELIHNNLFNIFEQFTMEDIYQCIMSNMS